MPSRRYARIAWTDAQVQRLERAVVDYNNAIDDAMERYEGTGLEFLLPQKTDVATQVDAITTRSQLNMTVNSLNRIHRPGALDIDIAHQMTNYEYNEGKIAKSTVNRSRIRRIKELGGSLERDRRGRYRPADAFTHSLVNETSLMPNQTELTHENISNLRRIARELSGGNMAKMAQYYINYLREWTHYYYWAPEYAEVVSILNEVMDQDADTINNVFYSYDYYGTFDYMYPGRDRSDSLGQKAKNILNYWRGVKRKFIDNKER